MWGRPAGKARDGVGRAFQGLFEQRGFVGDRADRLAPGAVFVFELGAGAEVAEVALIDLKGLRQRHRDRFEVGVAGGGVEVELQGGVLAAGR